MTGFHFTGKAVSVLPEQRFPFYRIPGFRGPEYSKGRNELNLIEVKCSIGAREDLGRPTTTALENKQIFMEYLKTL